LWIFRGIVGSAMLGVMARRAEQEKSDLERFFDYAPRAAVLEAAGCAAASA
jgi:hypothetical protein